MARAGGIVAIVFLLSLRAYTQAPPAEAPPLPPPGRLIDIGGWRLHLNCTGERHAGRPTVVLEAGIGDFSVEWSLVPPAVANFTRVCSYDRAGDGWSDLGPHPRTMRQIVYELHALLTAAGERPPYVMTGHSYGGWLVRMYRDEYPSDVTGRVLVEPASDDPWRILADGRMVRSSTLAGGQAIPPVRTSGPLRVSDIPPQALQQMTAGLGDASRHANEPPRDQLPADARRMRTWALGQLGHVAAGVNPVEAEELVAFQRRHASQDQSLGSLPLFVILRGQPEERGPNAEAMEIDHRQALTAIAASSSRGRLIVAERSGHHVQIQQPDVVVDAIRQVWTLSD